MFEERYAVRTTYLNPHVLQRFSLTQGLLSNISSASVVACQQQQSSHPGAPGGGLAALLADLNERLDLLAGEVARPTSVSLGDVTHLERTIRRLEGIKLALIDKADRQDTHKRTGDSGTSSWLNGATRSGGGAAARQVDLAKALDETLPRTKEALGLGEVSTEAASVINSTMRKLGPHRRWRDSIETIVRDAKTLGQHGCASGGARPGRCGEVGRGRCASRGRAGGRETRYQQAT